MGIFHKYSLPSVDLPIDSWHDQSIGHNSWTAPEVAPFSDGVCSNLEREYLSNGFDGMILPDYSDLDKFTDGFMPDFATQLLSSQEAGLATSQVYGSQTTTTTSLPQLPISFVEDSAAAEIKYKENSLWIKPACEGRTACPRPGPYQYEWKHCRKSFSDVWQLRSHARGHTRLKSSCQWEGCTRPEESRTSLNKHLDTHIRPHSCPRERCVFRAATKKTLKRHIRTHKMDIGTDIYFCPFINCQYHEGGGCTGFSRRDNASRHIKNMHDSRRRPVAGILGK